MVDILQENRHSIDIHCVEVFEGQHCLVFSENRGIGLIPCRWCFSTVAAWQRSGRAAIAFQVRNPKFHLREERNARRGEIFAKKRNGFVTKPVVLL